MTALALLSRYWREIGLAALALALAASIAVCSIRMGHKDAALTAERHAHQADIASWKLASEKAKADDLANIKAVAERQAVVTQKVEHEYQDRLADSDARYERLRATAAAYSSRVAKPGMSETSNAACLAYAAARCDELPAKMKAAQDQTDRLIGLQEWAAGQVVATAPDKP